MSENNDKTNSPRQDVRKVPRKPVAVVPPTSVVRINCPHCQVLVQLVDDRSDETLCPKCGSWISRDELARITPTVGEPVNAELPATVLFAQPAEQPASAEPASTSTPPTVPSNTPQRPPAIEVFGRFQLLKRLGRGDR